MKKHSIILICLLYLIEHVHAQSIKLSRQEKRRIEVIKGFCKYVKKQKVEELDQTLLFEKYLAFDHILTDTAQDSVQQKVFNKLLKNVDILLDTTAIKSYKVVPWKKYAYQENLPTMLWEKEPLTQIWGEPLPQRESSYRERVIEGKKQLENIMVCVKKEKPQEPLYYFLFDDKDQIVSWLLVNQGGLHYFLTF